MDERIKNVKFDDTLTSSPFLKPVRLHFERRGKNFFWDLALERDTVGCVLFHIDKHALMFVQQFRPPVFVRKVRTSPENLGKTVHEITWNDYPVAMGETIELCAGMCDKPKLTALQIMKEEIEEECGYNVNESDIQLIKKYIPSVSVSGSHHHVYYAEVDDTMEINEGGGNEDEGEFIKKVFMTIDEAKVYIEQEVVESPPGFLWAVKWFIEKYEQNELPKRKNEMNKQE